MDGCSPPFVRARSWSATDPGLFIFLAPRRFDHRRTTCVGALTRRRAHWRNGLRIASGEFDEVAAASTRSPRRRWATVRTRCGSSAWPAPAPWVTAPPLEVKLRSASRTCSREADRDRCRLPSSSTLPWTQPGRPVQAASSRHRQTRRQLVERGPRNMNNAPSNQRRSAHRRTGAARRMFSDTVVAPSERVVLLGEVAILSPCRVQRTGVGVSTPASSRRSVVLPRCWSRARRRGAAVDGQVDAVDTSPATCTLGIRLATKGYVRTPPRRELATRCHLVGDRSSSRPPSSGRTYAARFAGTAWWPWRRSWRPGRAGRRPCVRRWRARAGDAARRWHARRGTSRPTLSYTSDLAVHRVEEPAPG